MARELPHFHLKNFGAPHPYIWKGGGSKKPVSAVPDRVAHAQALLESIDTISKRRAAGSPGVYIEFFGRSEERLTAERLNKSDLTLLHYSKAKDTGEERDRATVFATEKGLNKLKKKVTDFQTKNKKDRIEDGKTIPGEPCHSDFFYSISEIHEAGLKALWRSPITNFPSQNGRACWEIWLEPLQAEHFLERAADYGVAVGAERLKFPEDIVVIAHATLEALATAIRDHGSVRALASPVTTADFFDQLNVDEQAQWAQELSNRTTYTSDPSAGYVTLLDTGVSVSNPLIQPALSNDDRFAVQFAWGVEDVKGHGTQMAGLSLYGDLTPLLQQSNPVHVPHRLESVKLLPDAGENPHHLLGSLTKNAVNLVENNNNRRRRSFMMASTTGDDTPHDGAPTSWSSEIDQLASGVSGDHSYKRLFIISAGNTDNFKFTKGSYLEFCDHEDNEIESPAQAWNSICVGAYTKKTILPKNESYTPVAPFGELSPSSRTATWSSLWPLKPDIVLEGGNWAADKYPPALRHGWLSLLSTHNNYPMRSFSFSYDTSAATALAAKDLSELWSDYPDLWPETIRGLYVSSARWTEAMESHLPENPTKGDYATLFQRYGYGIPDLNRARRSASNALTLIVEDTIIPYCLSEKGSDVHNQMKLFSLPWPLESLRNLGSEEVTLRVTLSTFIAPNPSEAARGTKYRYASHNLRFKLNRADEEADQFLSRISKTVDSDKNLESTEDDLWRFGSKRRDVGSLHIDELTCRASDLARRNLIAVHPVSGWWKSKAILSEGLPSVRFSLIVEIDAGHLDAQLYTEVKTQVLNLATV